MTGSHDCLAGRCAVGGSPGPNYQVLRHRVVMALPRLTSIGYYITPT
jgi:hypothetical protein